MILTLVMMLLVILLVSVVGTGVQVADAGVMIQSSMVSVPAWVMVTMLRYCQ